MTEMHDEPWRCPECGHALDNGRATEDGWLGWCARHGQQFGVQLDSQEPENPDQEEDHG